MSKHPWWWLLRFDPCPCILDDYYWDFIHVQASLMNIEIWSMSKHPWLCWLGFYQRPSIHNDDYCNFIHVEASYMMITVIWSMPKHSWWWLLQFNPCPSILDDIDWDFINVQAYLMMMGVWSMYRHSCWWSSGFNPCLKTIFFCWVVWIAQSGKALSFCRRGPGFESRGQPYAQCFHPTLGMWTLVEGWSIGLEPAIDITHAPAGSDTLRGLIGKSVEWYFPAVGQGWKRGGKVVM